MTDVSTALRFSADIRRELTVFRALQIKTAIAGVLLAGSTCAAHAQSYPTKPLKFVTSEVGGGSDFVARLIASGLASGLGQPIVVDNRAGGVIPGEVVTRAPADGYTLLVYGGAFWLAPLLQDKMPYDVVRDFTPIILLATSPNILVVNPSMPVRSVSELIALAKRKPGELNYSAAGIASSGNLAAELFNAMAAVNIVRINYKGTGQAVNDLIGGQVHLSFPNPTSASPHIKSGRLRAIAVTGAQPSTIFPELPTIAASGVPGYEAGSSFGMFGPAKLTAPLVLLLNQETGKVLSTADIKERFLGVGVETMGGTPDYFAAKMKSEMTRMGKVIRDAGIKGD